MKLYDIALKLNTLTIFRNLLKDPVISALKKLCESENADALTVRWLYGEFVGELYKHSTCLGDYVCAIVLGDDNVYVRKLGRNEDVDEVLRCAVRFDIKALNEVANISDERLQSGLKLDGVAGWSSKEILLEEEFAKKCERLPTEGYGIFSKYRAFTFENRLTPVAYPDTGSMADLKGYKRERELVVKNTLAFLDGAPVNNVLLYGDAGTGKSSTVKAILNEYSSRGLRLVELKKSDIVSMGSLIEKLAQNPLKFIIFIDDLSFGANDDSYATLKAVLEGSVTGRASNCVIYATSNRRHLIKERMSDRIGDEIHEGDTIQETMSLSSRFGLMITFNAPDKEGYLEIVKHYVGKYGIDFSGNIQTAAEAYAIRNGGRSPRVAKQFVQNLHK